MTKVFIARPAAAPTPPATMPQNYSLSPEAEISKIEGHGIVEGLKYPIARTGGYVTDGKFMFDVEIYLIDTFSKLPIRAVNLKTGDTKTFTDRLGCARFTLPRGHHDILIEGNGYLEKGFVPESTRFDPIIIKLAPLDSDSIFTVFSSGEVIQGERRPDNPGHNQSSELQEWLGKYWWSLALVGLTGVSFYYFGKSKTT